MRIRLGLLILVLSGTAPADVVLHVAVASNFRPALQKLAEQFEARQHVQVIVSAGSSGKLYAQIVHGAPFDAFFSADRQRPLLLEQKKLIVPGSRMTYAIGRLVLYRHAEGTPGPGAADLLRPMVSHLALANPELAPYGRAARETLEALKVWALWKPRVVYGENISQTLQFVTSGNAALGLVALAQVQDAGVPPPGAWWLVPDHLHAPIEQQAVMLRDTPAVHQLFDFLRSASARALLSAHGYELP